MTGAVDLAATAVVRQTRQSALATVIALLGLSFVALVALGVRAVVRFAQSADVPLGEVPVLLALYLLINGVGESFITRMVQHRPKVLQMLSVMAVQLALWAVAVAAHTGVRSFSTGALPICALIYMLAKPIATLLRPKQSCRRRLRRLAFELKSGVSRLSAICTGFVVILYVYLTVFTQLEPVSEVLVLGLGMPALQATCMMILAWLMEKIDIRARKHRATRIGNAEEAKTRSALAAQAGAQADGQQGARAEQTTEKKTNNKRDKTASVSSQVSLMIVLGCEMMYSTAAFVTLALAKTENTFLISLTSMLAIEVVQVAMHVKLRLVVSRATSNDTAETLLGNNQVIREWLLYQELGEKAGLLLALGFLAIDMALGRAMLTMDVRTLARRGVTMALFELASDLGKDVVSQRLGILPSNENHAGMSLSALCLAFTVFQSAGTACLVQTGLALGDTVPGR